MFNVHGHVSDVSRQTTVKYVGAILNPIGTADLIRVTVDVQHVCQCADLHLRTLGAIPVHACSRNVFMDTGIISSEVMAQ